MKKLIERQISSENLKTSNLYQQLVNLLKALEEKELPIETVDLIDKEIEQLNSISDEGKYFKKAIKEKENKIIQILEKKHKIVPKNYYRRLWMLLGMSVFGVSMGLILASVSNKMALFAIGVPIGMAIGIGVGSGLDKKAYIEGRQLDFEVKH
jgi:hypothetical protein